MLVKRMEIHDVMLLRPTVYGDGRGTFYESFNKKLFEETIEREVTFVQDNHSQSFKDVLRGLHYQLHRPQGKLVRVILGKVFDVAVDLRASSPTFGKWVGTILSAENNDQLWIPEGFAHGFLVLSDTAELIYKTTDYYTPQHERCIAWNDGFLGIQWPDISKPILSMKDARGQAFHELEVYD